MKEKLLYLMLILFVSASVFAQTGGGSAAFTIKGQVVTLYPMSPYLMPR